MSVAESGPDSLLRIDELLRPDAFPHPVTELRVVETHISWVVLTGSFAYKIKKPLKLDFIDTSTLERRQHYCNEELRINRRLAPELYLEVVPITRDNGRIRINGDGAVVEYSVRMRQFASGDELAALLDRGDVSLDEIERLAGLLARFHEQAARPVRHQSLEHTQRMYDSVLGNLEQLIEHAEKTEPATDLRRLWNWTRASIRAHESAFETRERTGCIRECHGDLHAANIVRIERRLVPFDCIDFDPLLRRIDVMNDIAFLIMDLQSRGRTDLSTTLLNHYLEITGDYDGVRLVPFYAVYRALVRAKVDAIAAGQSPAQARRFNERLQRRVRTALELIHQHRPALVLMHGPSGSGKSWLSGQLVSTLPALRIRSDLERKRLLGESHASERDGFKVGRYAPTTNHRVYARLVDCAESCLQAGFNVVIDAAFLEETDRELFEGLAKRLGVACTFISCNCDAATLLDRVTTRAARADDVSEADCEVVAAQLRTFQPLVAESGRHIIEVDTRDPSVIQTVVAAVRSVRDIRMRWSAGS